jgi:hypothetical protein
MTLGDEWAFWVALGLLVLTGVGNAGAFAQHLPTAETMWGGRFITKLFAVLGLILVSVLRSCLVAQWGCCQSAGVAVRARREMGGLYGATVCVGLAVYSLGLFLAHG